MATRQVENVLRHVRAVLARHGAEQQSDRALLRQFAQRRDEQAFAELVRRHGPMVLAVCRRVLHHRQDAEDAFQATFLVLARKAGARGWHESIASWLYLVARRLALRLRAQTCRQREREARAVDEASVDVLESVTGRELCAAVDEELSRLPKRYRAGIVLCCLQGRTRDEAARQLGWSPRMLKRRLERGRAVLRARLERRGFELPAALAGALVAEGVSNAAVPSTLLQAVMTAATTGTAASLSVGALAETVVGGELLSRLRVAAGVLLTACLIGSAGLAISPFNFTRQHRQQGDDAVGLEDSTHPTEKTDQYGDPLPLGAVARMGTIRLRHSGSATAVVFSGDGKAVISAGADGSVNMWDAATGKRIQHLPVEVSLHSLAMSPDSKTIAVGDWRGEGIRLVDMASFKQVRFWKAHSGCDIWVDFAPDGSLLSASDQDAEIILWNPATGKRLRSWQAHKGGVRASRFSTDGKIIASSGISDNTLAVWDAATGQELWRQTMADNNPHGICFASDGKTLFAGGSGESHVTVWGATTGKFIRRFEPAKGGNLVLAITPDGKTLAAEDRWGECRLWDVASGKPLRSLKGCREDLLALAFSPDGKMLAAAGRDESVHLWDVETGKERHVFPAHVYLLTSLVFTADGTGLLTCGFDVTVRQWDAETGRHLRQLAKADEFVMQLALSPDGATLAAATSANFSQMRRRDGAHLVRLWDLKSGRVLEPLKGFEGSVGSVAFSPDGKLLASRDDNGPVRIWDTATWRERTRIDDLREKYGSSPVIFSPDGRWIATGKHNRNPGGPDGKQPKRNQELGLWDVATGRQARRFLALQEHVRLFAFTPDGRTLIAAGFGQPVRYWETATGKVRFEFGNNGKENPSALALSPDGRTLALASYNNPIRLLDVATGQKLAELDSGNSTRGVECLVFSRDGRRLASAESDSTAIVWDVESVTRRAKAQAEVADAQLDTLWHDLIGNDAAKAFRAMVQLAATPAQAVPLVRKNLKAEPDADAERIRQWLADLDNDQFAKREKATRSLEALGDLAEPALRMALENPPSTEVRRRIEKLLAKLNDQGLSGESLQAVQAIELLEHIAAPEARQLLEKLATGAPEARLTYEAKAALERRGSR